MLQTSKVRVEKAAGGLGHTAGGGKLGFLRAVSLTIRLRQNVRLSLTRARVCSGKDRTVLLSLANLARNLGEISSVPEGNGLRVRVKMKGVDISDLSGKSKTM